jgi:hypothetical protein
LCHGMSPFVGWQNLPCQSNCETSPPPAPTSIVISLRYLHRFVIKTSRIPIPTRWP